MLVKYCSKVQQDQKMPYSSISPVEKFALFVVLMGTWGFFAALGYLNLTNCPIQPFIPIYMFGCGCANGLGTIYW